MLPFLPGHYDHLFWGTWVPQACFNELAIQHAMIAVGALHESVASTFARESWVATRQQLFSVQQYNKAIQYLTNTAYTPSAEVILTSCIIFIMYENLYGRNAEASKHLKSGIAMLKSWLPTTSSARVVDEEYLTPIYTRGYAHTSSIIMPPDFDNLESARKHLQVLLDMVYSSVNSSIVSGKKGAVCVEVFHARNLLQEWYNRFATLEEPRYLERRRAKLLLRLQFETASVLLVAVLMDDECEFDKQMHAFQVIIDQCEQLVAYESILLNNDAANPETFVYGFDLNIIPSLSIVAFKCRDPVLRRKAIALLNAGNRYEGLWNGKTVARIAQRTLEIEQAGIVGVNSCTDVPRKNRVRLAALSYHPDRLSSVSR